MITRTKSAQLRYQLWDRLCDLANEASAIADMWWDIDPELAMLHHGTEIFSLAEMRERDRLNSLDAEANVDLNDDPFISRPMKR